MHSQFTVKCASHLFLVYTEDTFSVPWVLVLKVWTGSLMMIKGFKQCMEYIHIRDYSILATSPEIGRIIFLAFLNENTGGLRAPLKRH